MGGQHPAARLVDCAAGVDPMSWSSGNVVNSTSKKRCRRRCGVLASLRAARSFAVDTAPTPPCNCGTRPSRARRRPTRRGRCQNAVKTSVQDLCEAFQAESVLILQVDLKVRGGRAVEPVAVGNQRVAVLGARASRTASGGPANLPIPNRLRLARFVGAPRVSDWPVDNDSAWAKCLLEPNLCSVHTNYCSLKSNN